MYSRVISKNKSPRAYTVRRGWLLFFFCLFVFFEKERIMNGGVSFRNFALCEILWVWAVFLFCRIDRWKQREKNWRKRDCYAAMYVRLQDWTGKPSNWKNCIKKNIFIDRFYPITPSGKQHTSCVKLRLWLSLILEGGTLLNFLLSCQEVIMQSHEGLETLILNVI